MWQIIGYLSAMVLIALLIHSLFVIYVARQASDRGFQFWQWMVAGILSNSIVFVIILSLLPDKSVEQKREAKRKLLREKLTRRRANFEDIPYANLSLDTSIGDMATFDPERMGMMSIGDQATQMPVFNRSLDDAPTQLGAFEKSNDEAG